MMKTPFLCIAIGLCSACGSSDAATSSGASNLSLTIAGAYETYPHQDGFSGQTAERVTAGLRGLELIDDAGGTWVLFDASPSNLTADYSASTPTLLATIEPADVRPGRYVKARMVQDWSRFEVAATLHEAGTAAAGTLRVLQATSEGAVVEGKSLEQGHYEHAFSGSGVERSYDGVLPVPEHSATAEAEAFDEQGVWAVYFPVAIEVPAGAKGELAIRVSLDRAFRWSELGSADFTSGAYDIAPPIYEPVEQFGGNRFSAALSLRR